jgi:hypothetical protein
MFVTQGRESLLKGKISTVDLLVLISLDHLFFILKLHLTFYIKTNLNENVNNTGTSPSVWVPSLRSWNNHIKFDSKNEKQTIHTLVYLYIDQHR